MKTVAILNLKGGVGKTVTAVNMAAILAADHAKHVLLIDCDSQCNASDFFGVETDCTKANTLAELMSRGNPGSVESYIQCTHHLLLDMIAASDRLMDFDIDKISTGAVDGKILLDLSRELDGDYDYMIFDCPPAFNAASAAALLAAQDVIIPIKLDAFAMSGMTNLMRQIGNMQKINPNLRISGLLVTMWRATHMNIDALEQVQAYFKSLRIFKSKIRRTEKVDEMTFERRPITDFSPRSAAGVDYRRFVREYMQEG